MVLNHLLRTFNPVLYYLSYQSMLQESSQSVSGIAPAVVDDYRQEQESFISLDLLSSKNPAGLEPATV